MLVFAIIYLCWKARILAMLSGDGFTCCMKTQTSLNKELRPFFSGTEIGICLKTLALLGSALEMFRKFFGAVRAMFWFWGSLGS